ncbi:MAG: response regulator [Burkholderiales bacterium]
MPRKILIVEDDHNILISLDFLMRSENYDTRTAGTGNGALAIVGEFIPDLILLDVMLPMMNGFEVCQTLRANPALNALKIVMLTAKGRESEIAEGMASGADAYITKPFATRDLVKIVKQLLGD